MNVRTDQAHTQVFADGASTATGVAAAAIIYIGGIEKARVGIRLGDQKQHSVLDAELAGILLAAHLIQKAQGSVEQATIFTDSQSALRALEGENVGATQGLVRAASRAIREARRRGGGIQVKLQWCPGHEGIQGNALADKEAKLAASGSQYPVELIPRALANYQPPTNPTTLKKKLAEANREAAREHWNSSKAGIKHIERYPNHDPRTFLQSIHHLPRDRSTLLYKLITGHAQLNAHLHRLQVVDTPVCSQCGDAPETVAHFLLRCTYHEQARQTHLASRGRHFLNLEVLFSNRNAQEALFRYIRATGRLSDQVL